MVCQCGVLTDWCFILGNGIGDICEEDFDGDGVNNTMDTDPENKKVQRTDFRDFLAVTIDPANRVQIKPIWRVTNNVSGWGAKGPHYVLSHLQIQNWKVLKLVYKATT